MRGMSTLLAVTVWLLLSGASWSAHQAAKAGERALAEGDPQSAVAHFARAAEADPSPLTRYNLGTALLAAGEAERAAGVLAGVARGDDGMAPERLGDAAHNLGNALLAGSEQAPDPEQARRMLKSAIDAYRTAIAADPQSEDARTNLQLAALRLQHPDPRQPPEPGGNAGQKQPADGSGEQGDSRQEGRDPSAGGAEPSTGEPPGDAERESGSGARQAGSEQGEEQPDEGGADAGPGGDEVDAGTEDGTEGGAATAAEGDPPGVVSGMPADEVARILEGVEASEAGVLRDAIRRATGPGKTTERDW